MRRLCVLTTVAAAALVFGNVVGNGNARAAERTVLRPVAAEGDSCAKDNSTDASTGGSADGSSDEGSGDGDCPCHGGGRRDRRNGDKYFNCNCNGSYKFPVPPLYTYHWPGLYSMKRMTDYHSPWRFPAIKPYEEETPVRDLSQHPGVRQASNTTVAQPSLPAGQSDE